jgi:FlaA1/EpsC-like NDP-sugar epimerase
MRSENNPANEALWEGFLSGPAGVGHAVDCERFAGKRVLITGAGGFLGSAVAARLAYSGMGRICLLDIVEHGLHRLQCKLERTDAGRASSWVVGSINDLRLLHEIFAEYRPQIVVHAAALKHVPLMQTNVIAAASTNILGSENVLSLAALYGVERCLLVSTDKAVDPIGVMGATKHIAEKIAERFTSTAGTRVIRLCNVLGSTGSVAPMFARQITRGEDLTVTHPDATRFFNTRAQAVEIILEAALNAAAGPVSIPAWAEQRKIEDLAVYLMSRSPESRSKIVYTQLRAGERLHECLWSGDEVVLPQREGSRLREVCAPSVDDEALQTTMAAISNAVQMRDVAGLRDAMQQFVSSGIEEPA